MNNEWDGKKTKKTRQFREQKVIRQRDIIIIKRDDFVNDIIDTRHKQQTNGKKHEYKMLRP